MKKNSIVIMLFVCVFFSVQALKAQCTDCDTTGPTTGNVTFLSNTKTCFTADATLANVIFQDNSSVCIAPGVTVTITNNIQTTANTDLSFDIQGTLTFIQNAQFNANVNIEIADTGLLQAGNLGLGNLSFDGSGSNSELW